VYKARDTRLERIVAIKVLPPTLSQDEHSRQRLEREARSISSLNHPHICTLHDIGHQDGTDYLVMEYLQGESLADRLDKGPIPTEQLLRYASEIADALDKAHRAGIIHRDLKPGNIMLTKSGAKVLDFGLAKEASVKAAISDATMTLMTQGSPPLTAEGAIVGTFQYMAPEQLEGKGADARSDIFSFGCVLYEMATGKKAFTGKTQASLIAAILTMEPQPIPTLVPTRPPALDRVVKTCLAKEPDDRFQSAYDLKLQLNWVAEGSSQTAQDTALPNPLLPERAAWLISAVLGVSLIGVAVGWWRSTVPPPQRSLTRLSAVLPPGIRVARYTGGFQLAISPDGTHLAIIEEYSRGGPPGSATGTLLATRRLEHDDFAPVSGAEGANMPFFSPDGQWIGFFAAGKLKKVSVQGGSPVTLCDAPTLPVGASWGDDDNIIIADRTTGLMRIPSGGGAPTPLPISNRAPADTYYLFPEVLPGSKAVLLTLQPRGQSPDDSEIDAISLRTGQRQTIVTHAFFSRYLASGHLVYMRQNTLYAVQFDPDRLALGGASQPVIEDVFLPGLSASAEFASSQTGTFVYLSGRSERPQSIFWLESSGRIQPLPLPAGFYFTPRFSPDGERLAFASRLRASSRENDLWIHDVDSGTTSRLTNLPGANSQPVWTPDGSGIVFESLLAGTSMYWVRSDGVGEAQRLTQDNTRRTPTSFSPDGKRLVYTQAGPGAGAGIWTAPFEGDRDHPRLGKPEPFLQESFLQYSGNFSPDGHWLAYVSLETGIPEVYVRPFPGPGPKRQVSTSGGFSPIWSDAQRALFFTALDRRIMFADYTVTNGSFVAGKPRVWSEKPGIPAPTSISALTPDGKRFAVVLYADGTAEPMNYVTVLLNFFDELHRRTAIPNK